MIITEIKFYQLPYNYFSNDRFYKKEGQDVVLPEPIPDTTLSTQNEINEKLTFINKTLLISFMNIKGDVNFNYVKITDEDGEITYWFVISNKLIISDYNKLTLKKDILTSMELIKPSKLDETIKIGRKLYDNFNINTDTNKISYKEDRNPHIWNNQEFNKVIPQEKNIKPFALSSGISVGTDAYGELLKFENGNFQFKVPEKLKELDVYMTIDIKRFSFSDQTSRPSTTTEHRVVRTKLSPLFSILNEIIQTTNYKTPGSKLSHLATFNEEYVNNELSVYTATTLRPVVYNNASNQFPINPTEWFSWRLTRDVGNYDYRIAEEYIGGSAGHNYSYFWDTWYDKMILKDIDEWVELFQKHISTETDENGNPTYICPWNKSVRLNDVDFIILIKHILSSFINNLQELFSGNTKLKSVDAYSHWVPMNLDIYDADIDGLIEIDIVRLCNNVRTDLSISEPNRDLIKSYNPTDKHYNVNKHLEPYTELSSKQKLNKKVEHIINDELLTEWDKYKCLTPQLFSPSYDYNYIDIIGNQLPLDNYKMYNTSDLLVKTWFGSGEQNISYYQGDLDVDNNVIEPRYVNKFAFTQPIEFSIDEKEKILELNKNRLDARLAEVSLAKERDTNQFTATTKRNIDLAQSITDSDIEETKQNANVQKTLNKSLSANQVADARWNTASSTIRDLATISLIPGIKGKAPLAVAGSIASNAANLYNRERSIGETLVAQNQAISSNTVNRNAALGRKNSANAAAYQLDEQINIARSDSSAQSELNKIQADIADIKLTPNQTMNVSNITKMLSLDKGEISIINENVNEHNQKEMFKFWNKHGINNWKSISTKDNWYKEFSLFDYFQGGDWTKYLSDIGEYNVEVIQEFNTIMSIGLRLHHQSAIIYDKLETLGEVDNLFDINHDVPNWPTPIVDILIDPIERARVEELERQRLEEERIERERLIEERANSQGERERIEEEENERLAETARVLARARNAEATARTNARQQARIERSREEETQAERDERRNNERAERESARRELELATARRRVAERRQELAVLTSSDGIINFAKQALGITLAAGAGVATATSSVAASSSAAASAYLTAQTAAANAFEATFRASRVASDWATSYTAASAQGAAVAGASLAASANSVVAASAGPIGIAIGLIIGVVGTRLYVSELNNRRISLVRAELSLFREELSYVQQETPIDEDALIRLGSEISSREAYIEIVELGEEARRQ